MTEIPEPATPAILVLQFFDSLFQLGSLVVLPLIFLFMIPMTGAATLGPAIVLVMALIVGIVDVGLMWFTLKVFNRENILVNWS